MAGTIGGPLVLALAAPPAVLFGLLYLRSVWWIFAIYHAGICIVAPLVESRRTGRSWRAHLALLGLNDPRTSGFRLAMALGLATALATGAFLLLTGERFLDAARLRTAVADWGVSPGQVLPMLAVMAVLNAPAEELFWRGYIPGRMAATRPSPLLTIVLPAVLYASYHAVTIARLVGDPVGVAAMIAGVVGAGLLWGWLRQRTGSVWMPLLSHAAAVLAYLLVYIWITGFSL